MSKKKQKRPKTVSNNQAERKKFADLQPLIIPAALGLLIGGLFLYFDLSIYDQYEFPKSLFLRIATPAIIAVGFIDILRRGFPTRFAMLVPFLAFLLSQILSTIFSESPVVSFIGTYESVTGLYNILMYCAIFVLAAFWVRTERSGRTLFLTLCIALLALMILSVMYRVGYDLPTLWGYSTQRIDPNRVGSTLGNPNFLAAVIYMSMPIVAVMIYREKNRVVKAALAFLLALMVPVMSFTGARTGYFIPFLLLPAFFWLKRYSESEKKPIAIKPAYITAGLAVVGVSAYISRVQLDRFLSSIKNPFAAIGEHRIYFWKPALKTFLEYPFFGSGVDTFKAAAARHFEPVVYKTLGSQVAPLRAHNEFLNTLSNTGLIGACAWLAFWGAAVYYGIKCGKLPEEKGGYLARGATLGIIAIFAGNLLNFNVAATFALSFALAGVIAGIYSANFRGVGEGFAGKPFGLNKKLAIGGLIISIITIGIVYQDSASRREADRLFFKGYVKTTANDFRAAEEQIEQSVALQPDSVKYVFYLAQIKEILAKKAQGKEREKLIEQAKALFERSIVLERLNTSYHSGLGRVYQLSGDLEKAYELMNRALEMAPNLFRVQQSKLFLLLEMKRWPEARKLLDKIIADWGEWEGFALNSSLETARILRENKRQLEAIEVLEKAIELNPSYAKTYFYLAVNHFDIGNKGEAKRLNERSLELEPDFALARQLKGMLAKTEEE